jgi:hypothetical protein
MAHEVIHGSAFDVHWNEFRALSDGPDAVYPIPESGPLKLIYNGLPLDEIEDLLPNSPAYRQASRILFAPPKKIRWATTRRP